jgi:hypothetical protein
LTAYDEKHLIAYLRMLGADADSADWREVARLILGPAVEVHRAELRTKAGAPVLGLVIRAAKSISAITLSAIDNLSNIASPLTPAGFSLAV